MTKKEIAQVEEEKLYIYSGILFHNQEFARDGREEFTYDFSCPEYGELKENYDLVTIAGKGTDFQRAKRLMHEFAPRLTHCSWYDNHIECNALKLLEYSLDNPERGINCLNKSKILQEMCLALGIYARRVSIMPHSPYDFDNHVVTEIFDRKMNKWIMLDMTTDCWLMDENKTPLSLLEAREGFAGDRFVTAVSCSDKRNDLPRLREKNMELNAYYAKNLFYFKSDRQNRFGKSEGYLNFCPANYAIKNRMIAHFRFTLNHLPAEHEDMRPLFEERLKTAETDEEPVKTAIEMMEKSPIIGG